MNNLYVKRGNRYIPAPISAIAEAHMKYATIPAGTTISSPADSKALLETMLCGQQREQFTVLLLDNRHRVIDCKVLFQGTIDAAAVYPREVVKTALEANAAAVILAHNHPSGVAEPSESDRIVTKRIRDALELVDIRLLDHFVIGSPGKSVSLATRGMI